MAELERTLMWHVCHDGYGIPHDSFEAFEITDEMVERAAEAFAAYCCGCMTDARAERAARKALEAALGEERDRG